MSINIQISFDPDYDTDKVRKLLDKISTKITYNYHNSSYTSNSNSDNELPEYKKTANDLNEIIKENKKQITLHDSTIEELKQKINILKEELDKTTKELRAEYSTLKEALDENNLSKPIGEPVYFEIHKDKPAMLKSSIATREPFIGEINGDTASFKFNSDNCPHHSKYISDPKSLSEFFEIEEENLESPNYIENVECGEGKYTDSTQILLVTKKAKIRFTTK